MKDQQTITPMAENKSKEITLDKQPLKDEIPALPKSYLIDVPFISQLPELTNGCEVTSLGMLLAYVNVNKDKIELMDLLPKDDTKLVRNENGVIQSWGDPDKGFVGDMTGNEIGYAVNHEPIEILLNQVYEPGAEDLTGASFYELENHISENKPVIAWVTSDFEPTDEWVEWKTIDGRSIEATFKTHTVLVVGYDEDYVYVNNPLGKLSEQIDKNSFIETWKQMGSQAVTIRN